jgi:hypothetical protein
MGRFGAWAVAAAVACVAATPVAAQAAWKAWRSAELGLSASFPVEPEVSRRTQTTDAGDVPVVTVGAAVGDGYYAAVVAQFPPTTTDPDRLVDGAIDGMVRETHGTLVSVKKITVSGAAGREAVIDVSSDGAHLTGHVRVAWKRGRLYQAIVVQPAGGPDEAWRRFFAGWKID